MARIQAPVGMLPFRVGAHHHHFLHQEHSWKLVGDNENVVLVYNLLLLLLISYILSFSLSQMNLILSKSYPSMQIEKKVAVCFCCQMRTRKDARYPFFFFLSPFFVVYSDEKK